MVYYIDKRSEGYVVTDAITDKQHIYKDYQALRCYVSNMVKSYGDVFKLRNMVGKHKKELSDFINKELAKVEK